MSRKCCLLFDIDGTLTKPRHTITAEMSDLLKRLRETYTVAIVGGSNQKKIAEQLGEEFTQNFDYAFLENGLVAYQQGELISNESVQQFLGDEKTNIIVNSTLRALSEVEIPKKRGTFIELRRGLINISPIGRDCSTEERNEFEHYDSIHKIRETLIQRLRSDFGDSLDLKFSIGGQISFDVFPTGWDKTYCLRFLPDVEIGEIHFFGDKTAAGGNDYEIYSHPRTIGHSVTSFEETMHILQSQFML